MFSLHAYCDSIFFHGRWLEGSKKVPRTNNGIEDQWYGFCKQWDSQSSGLFNITNQKKWNKFIGGPLQPSTAAIPFLLTNRRCGVNRSEIFQSRNSIEGVKTWGRHASGGRSQFRLSAGKTSDWNLKNHPLERETYLAKASCWGTILVVACNSVSDARAKKGDWDMRYLPPK